MKQFHIRLFLTLCSSQPRTFLLGPTVELSELQGPGLKLTKSDVPKEVKFKYHAEQY